MVATASPVLAKFDVAASSESVMWTGFDIDGVTKTLAACFQCRFGVANMSAPGSSPRFRCNGLHSAHNLSQTSRRS
jgi:hypothetical protein